MSRVLTRREPAENWGTLNVREIETLPKDSSNGLIKGTYFLDETEEAVTTKRETNWFKLLKFPFFFLWYAAVGLSVVVAVWFVVDLVHVMWQLSFSNVGKLVTPSLIADALPDKAGWILIAAGSILGIQINRARHNFIRDLAKAIREGPGDSPLVDIDFGFVANLRGADRQQDRPGRSEAHCQGEEDCVSRVMEYPLASTFASSW